MVGCFSLMTMRFHLKTYPLEYNKKEPARMDGKCDDFSRYFHPCRYTKNRVKYKYFKWQTKELDRSNFRAIDHKIFSFWL